LIKREISFIFRFPNYTHFNHTFKARTGQSPSQYEEHNKAHYGAAKDSEDE
jgi:AraC-like DNA-binding protein